MKKIMKAMAVAVGLWLAVGALAPVQAAPTGDLISYQGKLTNADGTPVANGTQSATFILYENGTAVKTQTQSVSTLSGIFSTFLNIGSLAFDPTKTYELGVSFNGSETRQQIASVPVAQVAKVALNANGTGSNPIGAVVMWWSNGGAAPEGYAFCDGSAVNNPASPLNGLTLPDLRNKFARGVGNADLRATPSNGGADTINLAHSHTVASHTHSIGTDGNHSHDMTHTHTGTTSGGSGGGVYSGSDSTPAYLASAKGHNHTFTTDGSSRANTGDAGSHNHGGATGAASPGTSSALSAAQSIIPAYVGLVYIIRIY